MEPDGAATVTPAAKTWAALLRPAMLAIAAIALAVGLAVQFAGEPAVRPRRLDQRDPSRAGDAARRDLLQPAPR